jgi:hypothetical protein
MLLLNNQETEIINIIIKFPFLKRFIPKNLIPDESKIYQLIQSYKNSKLSIELTYEEAVKKIKEISKENSIKYKKMFFDLPIYFPSLVVVTGLNASYKSTISLYLLTKLPTSLKKVYICNEDISLERRLDFKDVLFIFENRIEEIKEIVRDFDVIVIDSVNMIRSESLFELEDFIKDLVEKIYYQPKILILISHQLKMVKNNLSQTKIDASSIFTTYTSALINMADVGLVLRDMDKEISIRIEKNRFDSYKGEIRLSKEKIKDLFKQDYIEQNEEIIFFT